MRTQRITKAFRFLIAGIFVAVLFLTVLPLAFMQPSAVAEAATSYDYLVIKLPDFSNSTMASMLDLELRIYRSDGGKITVNGSSNVISSGTNINFRPRIKIYTSVSQITGYQVNHTHSKWGGDWEYWCDRGNLTSTTVFPVVLTRYYDQIAGESTDFEFIDDKFIWSNGDYTSNTRATVHLNTGNFETFTDNYENVDNKKWYGRWAYGFPLQTGEGTIGKSVSRDGKIDITLNFAAIICTSISKVEIPEIFSLFLVHITEEEFIITIKP